MFGSKFSGDVFHRLADNLQPSQNGVLYLLVSQEFSAIDSRGVFLDPGDGFLNISDMHTNVSFLKMDTCSPSISSFNCGFKASVLDKVHILPKRFGQFLSRADEIQYANPNYSCDGQALL